MTYNVLESQDKLAITTPYMLRNDGELLSCGEIHPYIKSYRKETLQQTLEYLDLHKSFLEWFYNNSLNNETKKLIKNFDRTEETINRLWYLTNQEFCRVRTSNYKYKIGGDNGEIYFRISSDNFNWFNLIWNTCVKYIHSIEYVTIMKDPQTFGKQFDYIEIGGEEMNKYPLKDFIELEGEPLVESVPLTEAHWDRGVDIESLADDWLDNHWEELVDDTVDSILDSYESLEDLKEYENLPNNITTKEEAKQWLKNNVVNSRNYFNDDYSQEIAKEYVCDELDDLWDSAYNYFYDCCEKVVEKINEKILITGVRLNFNIYQSHSWNAGRWPSQYAEFAFKTSDKVDEDIQNELDEFSCEIRFSDEHDNGQYYGEEITWLDYKNPEDCNWQKIIFEVISDELINLDSEIYEQVFGDSLHINLNEELKDEVSENTLKKRRKYYLTHGLKNVFPSGLGEELINNEEKIINNTPYLSLNFLGEDIEKHDTLNPLLFDENDELKLEIKEAIEKIVSQFVEDLKTDGVKIEVKDVILVGSNVSYNYTKDSDLDVHIIVDENKLDCDPELYTLLYGAYRSLFNKNYNITIKGIPVEIYVELV